MDLKPDFTFRPLPPVAEPDHLPFPDIPNPLGPLVYLPGTWTGTGFNTIWRPFHTGDVRRFLELNLTDETIEFSVIGGGIPNRGLLQPDLVMFGVHYLQQISDANVPGNPGLHIEPGIWLTVPATTNPEEPPTVVRMASIPHGTTIVAQGTASFGIGAPVIPGMSIIPFNTRTHDRSAFRELFLKNVTTQRSQPPQIDGITQDMIDDPSSVLRAAIANQKIETFQQLTVSTKATPPVVGGGTSNTAFLAGAIGDGHGPNANAVQVDATFWIELVDGQDGLPAFYQLQYAQTVMLEFDHFTWPHVTVATLRQTKQIAVPIQRVDPDMPAELLGRIEGPDRP